MAFIDQSFLKSKPTTMFLWIVMTHILNSNNTTDTHTHIRDRFIAASFMQKQNQSSTYTNASSTEQNYTTPNLNGKPKTNVRDQTTLHIFCLQSMFFVFSNKKPTYGYCEKVIASFAALVRLFIYVPRRLDCGKTCRHARHAKYSA